ncbi:MAG: phage tail tape measure protein [Hyphomicrobiaceae bacterium]
MNTPVEAWTVAVDADTGPLQQELANATKYGKQFGTALTNAFTGLVVKGRSLSDTIDALAMSLSRIALGAAFKPLEQGLSQAFTGLLSGSSMAFANGGVFQGGLPVPFAAGGVISSPIAFPLGGAKTGIAGERGAEAIMPLARGPDGRLGVKADTGGNARPIVFNITTPDADSFRRSETQVAAMLARAVQLGQRNL